MKISKYNIYKIIDNRHFVINTLSSKFLEISKAEYGYLLSNSYSNITSELSAKLTDFGMIINDDFDELEFLKQRYIAEQNTKDLLTITIAPTLRCNFACPYCYENREGKIINFEEQAKILIFIEKQLKLGYTKFNMQWFGGEPLMVFDIIKSMSIQILKLCQKYNVEYNAFLTTNGYLLSEDIIKQLESLRINQLYITLDGPASTHNARRFLLNGDGTFDRIVSNLMIAKNYGIRPIIRMNIDKTNQNTIKELSDFVMADLKLPMYLGLVREYTDSCQNEKGSYFSKEEYAYIQDKFNEFCSKYKDIENDFPRQLPIYCRACKIGTFVIDHDLNIYKCENDIGRSEKRISTVEDYPFETERAVYNKSFYKWDPFEYNCCNGCCYMPICMGGCPFVGINASYPECEIYKYNFDNFANKHILQYGLKSRK